MTDPGVGHFKPAGRGRWPRCAPGRPAEAWFVGLGALGLAFGTLFAAPAAAQGPAQAPNRVVAQSGDKQATQTEVQVPIERALGAEWRPEVAALVNQLRMRQIEESARTAPATCARYEALFEPGKRYLALADRAERDAFAAQDKAPFVWVDYSYALCLKSLLFIAVDRGRDDAALKLANRIAEVSPWSAGAVLELGFLLSRQQRFEESLAQYQRGRRMAETIASQRSFLPMALRGIGAALIDLKRLDEAEAAYRESQQYDPASAVARHQLEHIDKLRR